MKNLQLRAVIILLLIVQSFAQDETGKKGLLHQDKIIKYDIFDKEFKEIFITKSRNISLNNSEKEFVYFGDYQSYNNNSNLTNNPLVSSAAGAWAGFTSAAKEGMGSFGNDGSIIALAMTGIGAVIGLGVGINNEINKPNNYLLAYDYTNENNEKSRIYALCITHEDDEVKIRQYMDEKLELRLKI